MVERRTLALLPDEHRTLEHHRDHDPRPYVRERCAALLKMAEGTSPPAVARTGLLKARDPDTVYGWLAHDEAAGVEGVLAGQHGGPRRGGF